MKQHQQELVVQTSGRELYEVTREVAAAVYEAGIQTGLCVVFCRHTSCSLVIQENADPSARRDLCAWLCRMAPEGDPEYTHTSEGADDMPSHLRSVLTSTSETIPVAGGHLVLGTWQGIFLAEHRERGHRRRLVVHILGE